MKLPINLICLILTLTAFSCKNKKAAHPQSELGEVTSSTGMNEKSILEFSRNLDKSTTNMNKAFSLVYTNGDQLLYVEKFSNPAGDQLYIEREKSDLENSINRYYFKRDSLVLIFNTTIQNTEEGKIFKDTKTYLRNYVVFKKSERTATSAQAMQAQPYRSVEEKPQTENFRYNISNLNDALQQRNQFEMVFDNITTYPDATFVMLKSKGQGGYKASVQLHEKDSFIDSLLNYPTTFQGEKLSFKWEVNNQQAVYVPEDSTSTSASGLKR